MPSTGTSAAIKASLIDPKSQQVRNTLVSQVLALSISLGFDAYDAAFGANTALLGDIKIAYGDFAGMTVKSVLAEANRVFWQVEHRNTL